MLAHFDPAGLKTIRDNIEEIGRYSRYRWDLLNLHGWDGTRGFKFPRSASLRPYDAVFVHCTLSYRAENLQPMVPLLDDWRGLKILMKQDEQYRMRQTIDVIRDAGFQLVLTCVPRAELTKAYPPAELPRTRFMHTFTGYVTEEMRALAYPLDCRPIDIGYRGSPQPPQFGRLAWEKQQIAEVFLEACRRRGLRHDIKSGWGDRFMGQAWFDFLGSSAGTVGVESGGSIFDFDGSVELDVNTFLTANPGASFEEISRAVLEPHEGKIHYGQIAPRHLEAAACSTAQLLYEGKYSSVFEAGRHYFPVKRDLTNLDEAIDMFLDPALRRRVVQAARADIIDAPALHYRSFVKALDEHIAESIP